MKSPGAPGTSATTAHPVAYTSENVMIVRNFPQNTSDTTAPTRGKRYAAVLKSECHLVASACPSNMYFVR